MKLTRVQRRFLVKAESLATFERLSDDTFAGRIATCPGVIAFGRTYAECLGELRSTLRDWYLLGLKLKDPMPVL